MSASPVESSSGNTTTTVMRPQIPEGAEQAQQAQQAQQPPQTPPLSPRKDVNFISPSPLHIRSEMHEQASDIARGDKENLPCKPFAGVGDKGLDKKDVGQRSNTVMSSAFLGSDAGSAMMYISPSDTLMSPCTAKLGLLKGKKFARVAGGGGVGDGGRGGFGRGYSIGGVRRLFGGRVVVREEEQAVKSKEMVKGENEQENEDTEMEMEKD